MKVKPILDRFEIRGIQSLCTFEDRVLVEHRVPGMEGSVFQDLGTEPTLISIRGSLNYGESRQDVLNLEELRKKFQDARPVPFVADITSATKVKEVVIKNIEIKESEKWPNYFDYTIELKEHVPEPPPSDVQNEINGEAEERQQATTQQIVNVEGRLEVEVELLPTETDYSHIKVKVYGTTDNGEPFETMLSTESQGIYVHENIPAGTYDISVIRE